MHTMVGTNNVNFIAAYAAVDFSRGFLTHGNEREFPASRSRRLMN
jgi:hypothetical protein